MIFDFIFAITTIQHPDFITNFLQRLISIFLRSIGRIYRFRFPETHTHTHKHIRACKYDSCIVHTIQVSSWKTQSQQPTIWENDGISAIDAKSDCHWNKLLSLFSFVCIGHILNQKRQTINFINWKSIHSLLLFINQTAEEKKQLFDYSISWQNDG